MNNLNFKLSELIYSETGIIHNINNMPDIKSLDCLLDLIYYCLQPIRSILGRPVIITSGFRCEKINKLIGGAKNSQHTKGQAADFVVCGISVKDIIVRISASDVEFDQLINEYDKWVHISFKKGENRKQILKY